MFRVVTKNYRAGAKRQTFHGHGARGKRATDKTVSRAALAAVLEVLYVLYVLPHRAYANSKKQQKHKGWGIGSEARRAEW